MGGAGFGANLIAPKGQNFLQAHAFGGYLDVKFQDAGNLASGRSTQVVQMAWATTPSTGT
jgi:hypothetical protein